MRYSIEQYLDAYVAARRTERQIARQEAAWNRWVTRARLARTLGDDRLAEAARHRALIHGEAAAWLRTIYAEQNALARQLQTPTRAERNA